LAALQMRWEGEALLVVQPVGRRLDDLESLVGQRVVGVLVRVDLHGHAAVGLLDGVGIGVPVEPEHLERVHVEVLRARPEEPVDVLRARHLLGLHLDQLVHLLEERSQVGVPLLLRGPGPPARASPCRPCLS